MIGQLHDLLLHQQGEPLSPCTKHVKEAGYAPKPVWMLWRREKYVAPAGIHTLALQPFVHCYGHCAWLTERVWNGADEVQFVV
jgi:hypothetical protein